MSSCTFYVPAPRLGVSLALLPQGVRLPARSRWQRSEASVGDWLWREMALR